MSINSVGSRQSARLSQSDKNFDVFNLKEGARVAIDGNIEFSEKNETYPDIKPGRYNGHAVGEFQSLFAHPLGQPLNKIRVKLKKLTIKNPINPEEDIILEYTKDSSLATAYITKDEAGHVNNISDATSTSDTGANSESNYRDFPRRGSISSDTTSTNSSMSGITQSSEPAASSNKNNNTNPNQLHPMNRGPFDFLWGKGGRGRKTRKNRHRNCKNVKSCRARPGKKCRASRREKGSARKSRK